MSDKGQRGLILDYLAETLFPSIDQGSEYNLTVVTSERGLRNYEEMNDSEFPAVFVASADEKRKDTTNRHFQSEMTVFIVGVVQADGNVRVQQNLDLLVRDVTKALYAGSTPGGDDPTHGGRVLMTSVRDIRMDEGDRAPHGMFVMEVGFSYTKRGIAP